MSDAHATASPTKTAPARKPDGFPMGWRRYRSYTLFGFTCIPMAISAALLLRGVSALGQGEQAWTSWLASLSSPGMRALNGLCLVFALYFAFRFGWVGRKIAAGRIGPIPKPPLPLPLLGLAPLGGFVAVWLILILILAGVIG